MIHLHLSINIQSIDLYYIVLVIIAVAAVVVVVVAIVSGRLLREQ